jgi:putative addiction module CopG family antidote
MSTGLSPENELFIQSQLERGLFGDRSAVINAGLELLRKRQALIAHLTESDRQLEAGEYTDYDDESLQRRFKELKDRVRKQTKSAQPRT